MHKMLKYLGAVEIDHGGNHPCWQIETVHGKRVLPLSDYETYHRSFYLRFFCHEVGLTRKEVGRLYAGQAPVAAKEVAPAPPLQD